MNRRPPKADAGGDRRPGERRIPSSATVVIPVLNGAETIGAQLDALAVQASPGIPWSVVVSDNGSTDGSRHVALAHADQLPGLKIVEATENPGSSHARNVGAAAAEGELLCFCDADDIVTERWLERHIRAAPNHDLAGGPLEVDRLNKPRMKSWRPTPRTAVGNPPASFAPSGNMSIWAEAFRQLDGFNESYLKSHDVELSQRALAAGMRLGWVPEAVVHYRYRSSLPSLAYQAFRAGRAGIQMSLDHPHASPRPTWRGEVAGWIRALARAPALIVSRRRRGTAVRLLAQQAGRLQAILQFRRRLRADRAEDPPVPPGEPR